MLELRQYGSVDVLGGSERIDRDHVAELAETLDGYLAKGQPQVVLDMQSVALIDSAGLELLLDTQEKFQRQGGSLKLAGLNQLCAEILKVTGVGSRFEVYADANKAAGSYRL